MTRYSYHTWDALNYYNKSGQSLYLGADGYYWGGAPKQPSDPKIADPSSYKSTSTGEAYSDNPSSKSAQYLYVAVS